jgi:hypothetical protein
MVHTENCFGRHQKKSSWLLTEQTKKTSNDLSKTFFKYKLKTWNDFFGLQFIENRSWPNN